MTKAAEILRASETGYESGYRDGYADGAGERGMIALAYAIVAAIFTLFGIGATILVQWVW
jgi:hypothetical protein